LHINYNSWKQVKTRLAVYYSHAYYCKDVDDQWRTLCLWTWRPPRLPIFFKEIYAKLEATLTIG